MLCKENVDRFVKYTGYGNAAGLLASHGLMGGKKHISSEQYSSDDEDSDTEEYEQAIDQIDPVLGKVNSLFQIPRTWFLPNKKYIGQIPGIPKNYHCLIHNRTKAFLFNFQNVLYFY